MSDSPSHTPTASDGLTAPPLAADPVAYRQLLDRVEQGVLGQTNVDPVRIDRFEIVERLGHGGLGIVYRARDPRLERDVAIKLLRTSGGPSQSGSGSPAALIREARNAAGLSHPNIVTVFDAGVVERGDLLPGVEPVEGMSAQTAYVVMELVEGRTLAEWIELRRPSPEERIERFVQAGRGLEAAHAAGLIHRDFKPSNVVVGEDGRARVVDFGLARFASDEDSTDTEPRMTSERSSELSMTGLVAGTPPYMAPEQHDGHSSDPRVDQFAFCVSLYECLSGKRPFTGRSVEDLIAHKQAGPPREWPDSIPNRLRPILARGLAADPDERFGNMTELLRALEGPPTTAKGSPWGAVLVVVGLGLVGAWALPALFNDAPPVPPEPVACVDGASAIDPQLWSAQRRDRLEQVIRSRELAYAPNLASTVAGELDRYAQELSARGDEACALPSDERQAALDCLAAHASLLSATAEQLELAGEPQLRQAHQVGDHLPDSAACLRGDQRPDRRSPDQVELDARIASGDYRGAVDHGLSIEAKAPAAADDARWQGSMAIAYHLLGDIEAASERFELAFERLGDGSTKPLAVQLHGRYASLLVDRGDLDAAQRRLEKAERLGEQLGGADLPEFRELDWVRVRILTHADPERAVVAGRELVNNAPESRRNEALARLATALGQARHGTEAIEILEQLIAGYTDELGADHPSLAYPLINLGALHGRAHRPVEQLKYASEGLRIFEAHYAESHPVRILTYGSAAYALMQLGRYDESLDLLDKGLRAAETHLGERNHTTAQVLETRAITRLMNEDYAGALADIERATSIRRVFFGNEALPVIEGRVLLADIYYEAGSYERAESVARECLEGFAKLGVEKNPSLVDAHFLIAKVAARAGRSDAQEHYAAMDAADLDQDDARYREQAARLREAEFIAAGGDTKRAQELATQLLADLPDPEGNDAFIAAFARRLLEDAP